MVPRVRLGNHATLWIDYGRPATRGRSVFTHGVLGDTLWRTGANPATQRDVSAPMRIGSQVLPAGRYALWTRAATDGGGYDLVVNSQSGQLGDPARYDA
jgi:hypothetical protein